MPLPDAGRRRFPAEWEPQSGVQLTWPHPDGDWQPILSDVEPVFARIGAAIARREQLLVVCRSHVQWSGIQTQLVRLADYGLEDEYDRYKRDLTRLGQVLDYDRPGELTGDEANFNDPYHFTDEVARQLAADLVKEMLSP